MERLDFYMARANEAYYATKDPFRDFVTAPEISQVFGELLGIWAAVVWQSMGSPARIILAEAGPGRGTLMADALRAIRQLVPDFSASLELHLIEASPRLRALQADRIEAAVWHDALDSLPNLPLLLIANEFLDALPIRQLVRRGDAWREHYVDGQNFVEADTDLSSGLEVPEGSIVEIGEAATSFTSAVAERVARDGGAALLIDYGPEHSACGDSLQALRGGTHSHPLQAPGEADLTAHVDFSALAKAARGAKTAVHGPLPQGLFLARLGLFQRTDRLARTQEPRRAGQMIQAAQRLAEPDRMGRLFKALAICHPDLPTPPGFSE